MISKGLKYLKKTKYFLTKPFGDSQNKIIDHKKVKKSSLKGKNNNNVYKICITGGPCSGKTTGMNYIRQRFSPNYIVYNVPEVATMAVTAGVNIIPSSFTEESHKKFTVNKILKSYF